MEDLFNKDISSSLRSAKLIDDDPETIINAHLAFLRAGADIILTSTHVTFHDLLMRLAGRQKELKLNTTLHLFFHYPYFILPYGSINVLPNPTCNSVSLDQWPDSQPPLCTAQYSLIPVASRFMFPILLAVRSHQGRRSNHVRA